MFGLARVGIPGLLLFAFWVYCIFDVIMADDSLVRNLPKGFWLLIVLFVPTVGGLAWLIVGRPERASFRPGDTSSRQFVPPFAPDDSPDFLRTIGGSADREQADRERARRLADWEAELKKREAELKRRSGDDDDAGPSTG